MMTTELVTGEAKAIGVRNVVDPWEGIGSRLTSQELKKLELPPDIRHVVFDLDIDKLVARDRCDVICRMSSIVIGIVFIPFVFLCDSCRREKYERNKIVLTEETLINHVEYKDCLCCGNEFEQTVKLPVDSITDVQVTKSRIEMCDPQFDVKAVRVQTSSAFGGYYPGIKDPNQMKKILIKAKNGEGAIRVSAQAPAMSDYAPSAAAHPPSYSRDDYNFNIEAKETLDKTNETLEKTNHTLDKNNEAFEKNNQILVEIRDLLAMQTKFFQQQSGDQVRLLNDS